MAGSNSPFTQSSVSSLLRGAASTANKIAEYQDALAAFDYQNSAHTDDAFVAYQTYLKNRIGSLGNGDITSQQKALSLTKTLESAYHSNVSANIQRANIAIMSGAASLRDKYGLLSDQFSQAISNGDYTLAQSIESQAYSVSQQIQYQEQQAASAANTLAEATARAGARGETQLAQTLKDKLDTFNYDYAHAGQKTADKMLGDFVKQNADTFQALGVVIPQGVAPNYFSVVDGVNQAIHQAYSLAGDAVAPFAEDGGQSYYDKAAGTMQNIPTVYGAMSATDLRSAITNPGQFSYNAAPDYVDQKGGVGGKTNPQVGYTIDHNGGVVPVRASTPWVQVPNSFKTQLDQLGLQITGQAQGGGTAYTVHTTDKTPAFIRNILPNNATTVVTTGQLGTPGLQFEADAQNGQGKAVYSITYDQNGKKAIYESSNLGDRLLSQDSGYDSTFAPNAKDYTQPSQTNSFWSRLGDIAKAGLGNFGSVFGGAGSPSSVIANAQKTQADIARQQAEDAAAKALLAKPLQLPALSLAAPPPLPTIAVAQPKPLPNLTIAKPAPLPVNQPTASPQTPAPLTVQGGNSLLQGGAGIRLQ